MNIYDSYAKEFITAFEQPVFDMLHNVPITIRVFRAQLIGEESDELQAALKANNRIEILDAICDILYVVAGTAITIGTRTHPELGVLNNVIDTSYLENELCLGLPCNQRMANYLNNVTAECEQVTNNMGFSRAAAFATVHKNNMSKLWPNNPNDPTLITSPKPNGKWLVRSKAGKVLKPLNHTKVDLTPYV